MSRFIMKFRNLHQNSSQEAEFKFCLFDSAEHCMPVTWNVLEHREFRTVKAFERCWFMSWDVLERFVQCGVEVHIGRNSCTNLHCRRRSKAPAPATPTSRLATPTVRSRGVRFDDKQSTTPTATSSDDERVAPLPVTPFNHNSAG